MNDAPQQPLLEMYRRQARARGFTEDPAQLAALAHLERLRARLIAAPPATHSPLRGALGKRLARLLRRAPPPPIRGLYLWGPVGRGKTWLMDLFFHNLPFEQRLRRHFHRFMQDVHAQLRSLGETVAPLEVVAQHIAERARVLCFDELFVTDIGDAMILGTLFGALLRRGVTLVVTSNVPPRDLYRDGLQRRRFLPAIRLLEQHTEVVAVDGGVDHRLRQLTGAGTYLTAGTAQTTRRLESLFERLADGGVSTEPIEIEGRRIPVVRAGGAAVWFEFAALCEGPRSQDDYIEIAREYQSVIVSDVPVLDPLHEDAARRFIALVDELYDHSVNLVLSAAAPVAQLYRGERLREEFQRTASRLAEMQSEEYLALQHRP